MNFEDALSAMREGKLVRLPCKCYYQLDYCPGDDSIINANGDNVVFDSKEILSDEWEIAK